MRQISILSALLCCGLITGSAGAQMTESRWVARADAISLNSESGEFLDTGSSLESDSTKFGITAEYQYMVADAWAVCASFSLSSFGLIGADGEYDGVRMADMWFLPVTLTARYEFQLYSQWQPYVGGGVNVAFLFSRDIGSELKDLGVTDMTTTPHFRYVLEAGVNYQLDQKKFVNLDLKYLDLATDLDFESATSTDPDRVDFDGSPWEIGLGIGWRF